MSSTDAIPPFRGFPPEALSFFRALERHNTRDWFEAHKQDYLDHVLTPARAFVVEMGDRLRALSPRIVADPMHNGSIFRIYRDTRFASDKRPYKDHLGILFWDGPAKKLAGPGFYFELDQTGFGLYCGWYRFTKDELAAYRRAVLDDRRGAALDRAVRAVERRGWGSGGQGYKRLPRGFAEFAGHARARYLLHTGFWVQLLGGRAAVLHQARLLEYCAKQWRATLGVFEWLREMPRSKNVERGA